MTPLEIEILLHYNCGATDYRDGDLSVPAVVEGIRHLGEEHLIADAKDQSKDLPRYVITERGRALVEAWCSTPLPEWIPGRWDTQSLRPYTFTNNDARFFAERGPSA